MKAVDKFEYEMAADLRTPGFQDVTDSPIMDLGCGRLAGAGVSGKRGLT